MVEVVEAKGRNTMTDQECIKHLEEWIEHLDGVIAQPELSWQKSQEAKSMYALARAALIVLRSEQEKGEP